jgi:hypothetical protein
VGWAAGEDLTTHSRNTYIGHESGRSNVADNSTFIGFRSGYDATAAAGNTVVGSCTLADDPTISNSVILARTSTTSNKVLQINENNAFGIPTTNGGLIVNYGTTGQVLTSQGTGSPPIWSTISGSTPIATPTLRGTVFGFTSNTVGGTYIGHNAGAFSASSPFMDTSSVGIGRDVLTSENGNGRVNVGVGHQSLSSVTTGFENVAVGGFSGLSITTAQKNSLLGNNSGRNITTGGYNTFLGALAGYGVSTGNKNTLVGSYSGYFLSTGAGNTVIGSYAMNGADATLSDQVILSRSNDNQFLAGKVFQINENNAFGIPTTNGGTTVSYGTSGQVLTSNGSGSPPSWQGGASGTFTSQDGKTITVTNGRVTAIV